MSNQASNKIKYLLATKQIDFASDVFIIILMQAGFTFNKDTHEYYADVIGNELATGNGYTQGAKILAGVAVTEDDVDDRCEVLWTDVAWVASGGSIGPACGAIVIDGTVANDPVVGFIDFGGNYTQPDGGTVTILAPEVRIS